MTVYSTGEVATLLTSVADRTVLETQLSHAVRTARFEAPPVRAGRRLWEREHVLAAARHFDIPTAAVLALLNAEASDGR